MLTPEPPHALSFSGQERQRADRAKHDELQAEIDRLRTRIVELETFADGMTELQNERVDEIDRLRGEAVKALEKADGYMAERDRLRGEVERLTRESVEAKLPSVEDVQTVYRLAAANADAERLAEALREAPSHPTPEGRKITAAALRRYDERKP